MKRYKSIFSESVLSNLAAEDQKPRNEYLKKYINPYGYEKGIKLWLKDHSEFNSNDVFGDSERLKLYITKNIKDIVKDEKELDDAWLLVQHSDNDIPFQEWFIKFLDTNSENYRYLYDRIAINKGLPQKYGTQTQISEQHIPEHPKIKGVKIPGTDVKYEMPGYFHNAGSDKLQRKSAKQISKS